MTQVSLKARYHAGSVVPTAAWLNISQAEWRFVFAVIGALWLLSTLPLAYAYLSTPEDKVFMGVVLNVPDHAQYFMWFREHQSAFLINNKMTPEHNTPLFFNLLWWVLANVGKFLGIGYAGMYQIMRASGIAFFLILSYRLCAFACDDVTRRRFAFLIICLTSGFGWVLILMKYTITGGELINPLDVYVAEGNTLLSAIGFPHFLAAALYIWCFELFIRFVATQRWRYVLACGLFAHFMGWQHAYDLIIVWSVLGAYALLAMLRARHLRWDLVLALGALGVLSFPPALYSVLLTRLDPLWKEILAQFANAGVYTPPLYRLPVLLGMTLLAALAMCITLALQTHRGAVSNSPTTGTTTQGLTNRDLLFVSWFLVSFLLIYIPADFQIHMLNGWQVPMGILAARWVHDHAAPWLSKHLRLPNARRATMALFIALILPTNVYLFAWRFFDLARHDYDYYLSRGDVAAMRWLDASASPDDVIFSSISIGQYVPILTGSHAYLAHWAQTADFFVKSDAVTRFFANTDDAAQRAATLHAQSVDFVFVGPAERRLPGFDERALTGLTPVYDADGVRIYRVKPR